MYSLQMLNNAITNTGFFRNNKFYIVQWYESIESSHNVDFYFASKYRAAVYGRLFVTCSGLHHWAPSLGSITDAMSVPALSVGPLSRLQNDEILNNLPTGWKCGRYTRNSV